MMMVAIFIFFLCFIGQSYQIDNGLGRTPQMGKIKITNSTKAIMNKTLSMLLMSLR
jgi:hypothetical protein